MSSTTLLVLLSSVLIAATVGFGLVVIRPIWDAVAARYIDDLRPQLISLNINQDQLPLYLRIWGGSLIGVFFLLAIVLQMYPVALAACYLVYVAPRLIVQRMIGRRKKLLRDQMVVASVALANTARAGLSLPQGLEEVAREIPKPLANDLRRIVFQWEHGRPMAEAITEVRDRLQLDGFTLFAHAINTCLERGGKVTEALDRISKSLAENQRIERKLEAETASGHKVVVLLGAFPLVFLAGFYLIDPRGTSLIFTTFPGQLVLLFVIALVYASVRWSVKILTIDI
jgi:tight adherence protein B